MQEAGTLVLVVGPSGAGKDTLLDAARRRLAGDARIRFARRVITRPAEAGGEEHEAVSDAEFASRRFALAWDAHGLHYGIPEQAAADVRAGRVVVANVSRTVIAQAAARFPVQVIEVTAAPATLAARLGARGRESAADIAARLARQVPVPPGVPVLRVANDGAVEDGVRRFVEAVLACAGAQRLTATYLVRSEAGQIEARARGIAVEQSVEMPLEAIDEPAILEGIVGRVEAIEDRGAGLFAVRIGLATATIGTDAGQLFNMALGNTSLQEDVVLADFDLPAGFPGPRVGLAGLRARIGAHGRALTAAAIKPQGLPPERLAQLAAGFARGGVDLVKDDHGLADQAYAPFAARVAACAEAVRREGGRTRYAPSVTGTLDAMRAQMRIARECGLDCAMVAPMIAGPSNVQALAAEFPDMALLAHPTLGGAARIAPELLIGKLFPLIGADAVIFPNYGGRFGYSTDTCRALARAACAAGAVPVPAGGMTLARVPELLDFYGTDAMLLIGGSLLAARERLPEATAEFVAAVADHPYKKAVST
jgi:ribulose-bisphosphate carboxylase large chain